MDWDRFNHLVVLGEAGHAEEAIDGLQKLVDSSETKEDNASILLTIGGYQKEIGRFDDARKTLAEARLLADHNGWIQPRALFFEASIDIIQSDWRAGLEKLDAISKTYATLLHKRENLDLLQEVRRKRGMALYELGQPSEARPLLEEASTVDYEKPTALYYLGRCYYDLGELNKSKESLRAMLLLNPDPIYQPSAHYMLGLIYHWQGQEAWAIRELEWCVENDTRDLVSKRKLLTALLQSSNALGLAAESDRYSKMLRKL